MTKNDIEEVFAAQTKNVQALEQAWRHINKAINSAYSCDQESTAETHTRLLAQVYCAFAEAVFSKIIHTPDALTPEEIAQVKTKGKRNIVEAWKRCVELVLKKVEGKNSGHVTNTKKKIFSLIDLYIYDPSLLRNKIAHGQWEIALNSNNTKVNADLTGKIQSLTVVDLYRSKEAFQSLFRIVEDIIESPNKAHQRDYWVHITEFETSQKKMATWTIENKISGLKKKKQNAVLAKQQSKAKM
ncbi:hypothetical protein [Photobacterium damselae]|uniref:hypothetical protein n=1 Tax=Photobacterium damselae TaxID=38293 RepID=UPI004068BE76